MRSPYTIWWKIGNVSTFRSCDFFHVNLHFFHNRYPDVPDYVDFAFKTARTVAAPHVKLFYNDYNVGSATGWSQAKSDRM